MADSDSNPNNELSPYYPSETPSIRGNGREWFTMLILLIFLLGLAFAILGFVL